MKITLTALACATLLAGCATAPSDTAQTVYATEAGLAAAVQVATSYAQLPRCGSGVVVCSDPATVQRILAAAQTASAAVLVAQNAVTGNASPAAQAAALAQATQALSALTALTSTLSPGGVS